MILYGLYALLVVYVITAEAWNNEFPNVHHHKRILPKCPEGLQDIGPCADFPNSAGAGPPTKCPRYKHIPYNQPGVGCICCELNYEEMENVVNSVGQENVRGAIIKRLRELVHGSAEEEEEDEE